MSPVKALNCIDFYVIILLTSAFDTAIYKCVENKLSATDEFNQYIKNLMFNYNELELICDKDRKLFLKADVFTNDTFNITSIKITGFSLYVYSNFLKNLKNLESIKIKKSNIMYVGSNAFKGSKKLKLIDLSNNNLQIITPDMFGAAEKLDLSGNLLTMMSKTVYRRLEKSIPYINISKNPFKCHCSNKWIFLQEYSKHKLITDPNFGKTCDISVFFDCNYHFISLSTYQLNNTYLPFSNVNVRCPVNVNSSIASQVYWISPRERVFGLSSKLYKNALNNVGLFIQPVFIETKIFVNKTTNNLNIIDFRGYFQGQWKCRVVSETGDVLEALVSLNVAIPLDEMFIFIVIIGFSVAGIFLCIAIIIGLSQYLKESNCCQKLIDFDNSELFEKRYVNTVIPVPYEENDSSNEDDDDEDNNGKDPLKQRNRHESYSNNDVQLIFTDEKLAEEYVKILEELKQASDTGDEKFRDRLSVLRNRFSIDFEKMRFELKRGMESLKTSAAALKLRKSVVQMRHHMRSITELCGSGVGSTEPGGSQAGSHMAQSISIVVIPAGSSADQCRGDCPGTDPNNDNDTGTSNSTRQPHKVFRFFDNQ